VADPKSADSIGAQDTILPHNPAEPQPKPSYRTAMRQHAVFARSERPRMLTHGGSVSPCARRGVKNSSQAEKDIAASSKSFMTVEHALAWLLTNKLKHVPQR
jgi:hypothetical protein